MTLTVFKPSEVFALIIICHLAYAVLLISLPFTFVTICWFVFFDVYVYTNTFT
jgi:hypothetical protein